MRTTAFAYTLPAVTDVSERVVTFAGLPPGRYLATYDVAAEMSQQGILVCYVEDADTHVDTTRPGLTYLSTFTFGSAGTPEYGSAGSGSGVVRSDGGPVTLTCRAGAGLLTTPLTSATNVAEEAMTFTRLDVVDQRAGTAGAAPRAGRNEPDRGVFGPTG